MLTFLSHFAFAFAQCTQAIGIRSGDSMSALATLDEGRRRLGRAQNDLEGQYLGSERVRLDVGKAAFHVSKPQREEAVLGV